MNSMALALPKPAEPTTTVRPGSSIEVPKLYSQQLPAPATCPCPRHLLSLAIGIVLPHVIQPLLPRQVGRNIWQAQLLTHFNQGLGAGDIGSVLIPAAPVGARGQPGVRVLLEGPQLSPARDLLTTERGRARPVGSLDACMVKPFRGA